MPHNWHRDEQDENIHKQICELVPEEDAWTFQTAGFHVEVRLVPVGVNGVALEHQDESGTKEPDDTNGCGPLDDPLVEGIVDYGEYLVV